MKYLRRFFTQLKQDIIFGARHGFYYAYIVLCVAYILILRALPQDAKQFILPLVIISDPAVAGFFFLGGIILLERGQGILESLFVTPLRLFEYIFAKVFTFTLLGLITSLIIIVSVWGISISFGPVIVCVILSSILFTLFGFPFAAYAKSINQYFIIAGFSMSLLWVPLVDYFGIIRSPLFMIFPLGSSLVLLKAGFEDISLIQQVIASGILVFWIGIAAFWAKRWFYKYIILNTGEDTCQGIN